MSDIRIRRKLDSETLYLPELRPLIGKDVEITVEERHRDDTECFSRLAAPKPPNDTEADALRELLTEAQYEALIDVTRRGGPDVDAIARMRSKSMT